MLQIRVLAAAVVLATASATASADTTLTAQDADLRVQPPEGMLLRSFDDTIDSPSQTAFKDTLAGATDPVVVAQYIQQEVSI